MDKFLEKIDDYHINCTLCPGDAFQARKDGVEGHIKGPVHKAAVEA